MEHSKYGQLKLQSDTSFYVKKDQGTVKKSEIRARVQEAGKIARDNAKERQLDASLIIEEKLLKSK